MAKNETAKKLKRKRIVKIIAFFQLESTPSVGKYLQRFQQSSKILQGKIILSSGLLEWSQSSFSVLSSLHFLWKVCFKILEIGSNQTVLLPQEWMELLGLQDRQVDEVQVWHRLLSRYHIRRGHVYESGSAKVETWNLGFCNSSFYGQFALWRSFYRVL